MKPGPVAEPKALEPWPPAQPYAKDVLERLRSMLGTVSAPWPGPYGIPLTVPQMLAIGESQRFSGLMGGTAPPATGELLRTISGGYLPSSSPYIESIMQGTRQLMSEELNRAIADTRARYARFGMEASSPAAQAESQLRSQMAANLANLYGQLGMQGLQMERPIQQRALEFALTQFPQALQQLMAFGEMERTPYQEALTRMFDEYRRVAQSFWEPYQFLGTAMTSVPAPTPQYGPPPLVPILGGLLSLITAPLGGTILGRMIGIR